MYTGNILLSQLNGCMCMHVHTHIHRDNKAERQIGILKKNLQPGKELFNYHVSVCSHVLKHISYSQK